MLGVLYDEQWEQVARCRKRTRGADGEKVGLERIVGMVHDLLKEASASPKQLHGIGAGCPGPVDLETGVVLEAVNLGWQDLDLQSKLEKEFRCPSAVLNDVGRWRLR